MFRIQSIYTNPYLSFDTLDAYIFLSDFVEWEPIEALTGTFQALHADFGKLIYHGVSASELLEQDIFFYDREYIVPTSRNGWGKLEPLPTPTISSPDWQIPDKVSVGLTCRRIAFDILNAMKCTYGSHRASIGMHLPLNMFVHLFHRWEVHRTPTMWIAKGEGALSQCLPRTWNSKVVQHNGDTIRCCVVEEKVVVRYHIGRQQLTISFPYRRWKQSAGQWDPLDSDLTNTEQVELHVCMESDEVHDFVVNDNWSLANLREYLVLRIGLQGDYTFVVDNILVRKRKESSLLCREIHFPRCIFVKPN